MAVASEDRLVRALAMIVALAACDRGQLPEDDRLATEGALQAAAISFAEAPPPRHPPPPPAPTAPEVSGPPVEIATFLRAHAHDVEPWRVTLYELLDHDDDTDGAVRRGPRFMGARVRRTRELGRGASLQVVAKLMEEVYVDGDSGGWTTTSLGIRVERSGRSIDLVFNAGHLFLTAQWHRGRFVVFDDALFMYALAERVGF